MALYSQGNKNAIRDFVFPIVTAAKKDGSYELKNFLGTGFLIGTNGFGVTARHVILGYQDTLGVMFVDEKTNSWVFLPITNFEHHPEEDISIIKIENPDYVWKTLFRIDKSWEGGWRDYLMAGYPADVVFDNYIDTPQGKRVAPLPDLIHVKGYIRRRVSKNLQIPDAQGNEFFELSTVAGKGCSGSPVFWNDNKIWKVIGVYVAEKQIIKQEFAENLGYLSLDVSYAVRIEAICNWMPDILAGKTFFEEGQNSFV
jgi:V8-like Glu-specific endopeptidase